MYKNVIRLISKWNRHINISNYLVTDSITKHESSVDFCLALELIGDYFTKSLQGSQFCSFRNIILGIREYYIPYYNTFVIELLED